MSIWVWAFANHKIDFNQFEGNHKLVKEISDKLNSLCLSDNEGICKKFKCPRGCKWEFEGCDEADDLPTTFQFSLGNYDLEISTNFIWIDTLCFPYTHWFAPRNDFEKNEKVDVVVRPEDVDVVDVEKGMLTGVVTSVSFLGVHYEIIVDIGGFKWMIQTTDEHFVDDKVGLYIEPDAIHIMKKSEYSGLYGDYSSYSEEIDHLSDIIEEE